MSNTSAGKTAERDENKGYTRCPRCMTRLPATAAGCPICRQVDKARRRKPSRAAARDYQRPLDRPTKQEPRR